ncbi:MAG: two pore domain potassium channel family protein [Chitinophagales bacterium]|nr:two pore domain potassium channel family protein [Hyphomicrobiales bacterium]
MALAALLAVSLLFGSTALHYEGLLWIRRASNSVRNHHRLAVLAAFAGVLILHLIEIIAYAVGYFALISAGGGGFAGATSGGPIDYFYFSAENYTTLGYGDITPLGSLRLLAAVEPISGLLLLAWSGAFLFGLMNERHTQYLDWRARMKTASGDKFYPREKM